MQSEQRHAGPKILQLDIVVLEVFPSVTVFLPSDFMFDI